MRALLLYLLLGAALTAPCMAKADEAKLVFASLEPLAGCTAATAAWLQSGCAEVSKPEDTFKVPCKIREGLCPISWGLPKDEAHYWPANSLPPIVVVRPMPRHVRAHKSMSHTAGGARTASGHAPPAGQSTAGRDTARGIFLQGAQLAGSLLGANLGIGIGVCTGIRFAYLVQDGIEAKETWTPVDTLGNLVLTGIGCSPAGFIMRMVQAKTDQERVTALLGGGLGFIPNPIAMAAGQVLPALPALMPATVANKKPVRVVKRQVRRNRVASSQ